MHLLQSETSQMLPDDSNHVALGATLDARVGAVLAIAVRKRNHTVRVLLLTARPSAGASILSL